MTDDARSLFEGARLAWQALPIGPVERNCVFALFVLAVFYAGVMAVELATRSRTDNYRSRDFAHDVIFWFYYRSGLHWIIFMAALYGALDGQLKFLEVGLLADYPLAVRAVAFLLISDFFVYWSHRAMHRFAFLWAFHTTHHAPERITFASSARFHPVEVFLQFTWYYVLTRMFGGNLLAWLPMVIFTEINLEGQHTQIPWRLGPLYRVFVTPYFHAYHHSIDPAHYDRNFSSGIFSFWDYLFGTAVREDAPPPRRLGLEGVKMPTVWSAVALPFKMAFEGLLTRKPPLDGRSRLPG
jgi:sterol desaturase/sphingolipid hydroxylase (fatty acid hydroxylase superfamily)